MKKSSNPQIIVIDENPDQTLLMAEMLTPEGFDIITGQNGPEALSLVQTYNPKLLITGLKIPQMDGLDLLKAAKKVNPSPEVILVTNKADINSYITSYVYGAYDYFIKPLNFEMFRSFVHKAVYKSTPAKMTKRGFSFAAGKFTPAPWPPSAARTKNPIN